MIAVLFSLLMLTVVITAFAVYLQGRAGGDVATISAAEAKCGQVISRRADESQYYHVRPGTRVEYPISPPAFGPHWGNYLEGQEIRGFYTVEDRPPVERLVHSLEHGYTILWYATDTDQLDTDQLRALSSRHPVGDSRLIIAPWTPQDGDAFPAGNVALTHWRADGTGVWSYCDQASAAAVAAFLEEFPIQDSPEPLAP